MSSLHININYNCYMNKHLTAYEHRVANQYRHYNKLFLELPYPGIPEAGKLLKRFSEHCTTAIQLKHTPDQIIDDFFSNTSTEQRFSTLFVFLQFIERQIVLFDALEECAFSLTHDTSSDGTLLAYREQNPSVTPPADYQTRIVLTAHPTQFYAPYVLSIIDDLSQAIESENISLIQQLLLQMSQTPFMTKQQPTPLDEATFLLGYLTDVFYPTLSKIQQTIARQKHPAPAILLGFWPGGDRDGNPNVDAETTRSVAKMLKQAILGCYRKDLERIQRRLTFEGVIDQLNAVVKKLASYASPKCLLADLYAIKKQVDADHDGLFSDQLEQLIAAVSCFGFYFASLDIRQDSSIHEHVIDQAITGYSSMSQPDKVSTIQAALRQPTPAIDTQHDVILSLQSIPTIQQHNGPLGCHRYIVSNTHGAHHILELLLLSKWANIDVSGIDLVPLFESITDLQNADNIMSDLYTHTEYRQHLAKRHNQQTIMLGFSDGTKDGGYTTANWAIIQAKKRLSKQAKEHGIEVIFFDGRGGPPARGGGNTHQYYRAQEADVSQKEIQLTIQGQTISSNFGTPISAQYNIEQLYTAGLTTDRPTLKPEQNNLLEALSEIAHKKYLSLKSHPAFLRYLEFATPLTYYGDLNIASRPPRRENTDQLTLSDLRAIPFVGAWSQMKQNVPGFYGLGTALNALCSDGKLPALQRLYKESAYFSTMLNNGAQSLEKTVFSITEYLNQHAEYAELWRDCHQEADLTKTNILRITQEQHLLEHAPITRRSIRLREEIVLPLQIIQQYALINLQSECQHADIMRKLVLKSMATNINAARNSA